MAIVVDEYDGVSGLVTIEDLIEEFVGDIQDEYDSENMEYEVLGEGRWRMPGSKAGRTGGLHRHRDRQ